ncbi:MAG: nucleotidyltransferase domain-containing protein [Coleofasciculus sp. G3-WIS-01]|uniref:nucleotidyltransferase family protein n=1 Tax=Coleofasciculus sp. G3-WIS-01 TaxID=3069528 RepID=UPI0032FCB2F1
MGCSTAIRTIEDLRDRRDELIAIFSKHGAHSVRVFGSVARGEATEQSDIDFLIDYDRNCTSAWFPGGLINDLESCLNSKVDMTTTRGLSPLIAENVFPEAIEL